MPDIFNGDLPSEKPQTPPDTAVEKTPATMPKGWTNERHTPGIFSHYCTNPDGVGFVNQGDDETMVLFLRRHFITNVPWILLTLFLFFLPIPIIILFRSANISPFAIPTSLAIVLVGFYYLIVFNYALVNFIVWFYHVGIITQKRLLDLDVYNILNHHLAETNISEVVDVSYSQKGFFQSFFNYGDVPIQTKTVKANFEFEESPRTAEVSDIITDLRAQLEEDN